MSSILSFPHLVTRALPALVLCGLSGLTQAATPFSATVSGTSQIVEVLNPTGPVVRVETAAGGSGSPGLLNYFSGDILDLSTGQGTGSNRFVASNGDQLFGSFSVQFVPGADASLFSLIGQVVFTGGTGAWLGASGAGSFLGSGQFVSASLAMTEFSFQGQLSPVPEPGSGSLFGLGLAVLGGVAARRSAAWRRTA
jgi:hypothetical protein